MKQLSNRIAVVTGAGSGIGQQTALALARKGCHLAIQDVVADRVQGTADAIGELGREVLVDAFDVSRADEMQRFADRVAERFGGAHIVVNNAGVDVSAPFEECSLEDWEWIVGVNLWGVIHGCRSFLPQLRQQDEGHVVNISSIFGYTGIPSQSAYCATKFAVRGLTESLHQELHGTSIGVTVGPASSAPVSE